MLWVWPILRSELPSCGTLIMTSTAANFTRTTLMASGLCIHRENALTGEKLLAFVGETNTDACIAGMQLSSGRPAKVLVAIVNSDHGQAV